MGDDHVYFMEVVSDTDSSDTTVNSGPTDDEESLLEPRQPLLAAIIRHAVQQIGMRNEEDDQHGAVGGAMGGPQLGDPVIEDPDDGDDLTQPGLDAEADDEHETELVVLDQYPEREPAHEPQQQESVRAASHDVTTDDDGQICTICFEPWTSSSEHRLVSLRCGHLFGRSCISKWLKGQGSRCPQCNARARKSEIRPIYARCLKVLDTTERDRALKDLERETEMRKKAEIECAQMRMRYDMVVSERDLLRSELSVMKRMLGESMSHSKSAEKMPGTITVGSPSFKLSTVTELPGGCRVLDNSDTLDLVVVSQQSANPLFKGFGLRKVSLPAVRLCEYVHIHHRAIKDVSFHSHNGLVLTASFDKTLKLTNCLNNSLVQTYNLDCEAWSCAWDLDDPCYFYAGLRTGHVYMYDIRVTDRCISQLAEPGEASPVIAIQYMKQDSVSQPRKCGLLVSHLSSCYYHEKQSSSEFEKRQLPLEGNFTSLSYESSTSHLLASCRPSVKHPRVTHTLCSLTYENSSTFQCNFVQSMHGGCFQAQLSRSKLTRHPLSDSSVLVCAGDEETKSAMIWDGSTGNLLSTLKAEAPVFDIMMFGRGCDRSNLATLTEKNLRIYNWSADC